MFPFRSRQIPKRENVVLIRVYEKEVASVSPAQLKSQYKIVIPFKVKTDKFNAYNLSL